MAYYIHTYYISSIKKNILLPFGPSYILAKNEGGNILREKFTYKLPDF